VTQKRAVVVWPIVAFPLNAAAAAILIVLRVPLLGRFAGQAIRLSQEALSHILNVGDLCLRALGMRLRKTLRLHVVVLRAAGLPVVSDQGLTAQIETARDVIAGAGIVPEVSVHLEKSDAPASVLDVGCNARAYWEDLWLPGCHFEAAAHRHAFHTAFLRLLGLGSPLFAFAVHSMPGGYIGCSLGAAADYLTLDAKGVHDDTALLAHEIGHALGLLHRPDPKNLMYRYTGRGLSLTPWQIAVMRGSRHVTFF